MTLSVIANLFFGFAAFGLATLSLGVWALWRARRRTIGASPTSAPGVSIIKPLCGRDDELELNLKSHLDQDYAGEWEILLGVRNTEDLAYPTAVAFAQQYPDKVRVVVQQGEPGHNPKVNQLITLTRAAKYPIIAATDSNVRVAPHYLSEAVAVLEEPGCGLATHFFIGVGEQRLGAVFDNLTLALSRLRPLFVQKSSSANRSPSSATFSTRWAAGIW
jgi:ceramide glucosyltransferase